MYILQTSVYPGRWSVFVAWLTPINRDGSPDLYKGHIVCRGAYDLEIKT